jgi:hypothetical protein
VLSRLRRHDDLSDTRLRMERFLDLACQSMRLGESRLRVDENGQEHHDSAIGVQQLQITDFDTALLRNPANVILELGARGFAQRRCRQGLTERLQVRANKLDRRDFTPDRRFDLVGDILRQLQVQRNRLARTKPEHVHVVCLTHPRHALRCGKHALLERLTV